MITEKDEMSPEHHGRDEPQTPWIWSLPWNIEMWPIAGDDNGCNSCSSTLSLVHRRSARSFSLPPLPRSPLPSARMPVLSLACTYYITAGHSLAVAGRSLTQRTRGPLHRCCLPLARSCRQLTGSATCLQQPLITVTVAAGDIPHHGRWDRWKR